MMPKIPNLILAVLFLMLPLSLSAQTDFIKKYRRTVAFENSGKVASNSVSQFAVSPNRLWLGTGGGLNLTTDGGASFGLVTDIPRFNTYGIYALDVKGDTVWASTAYISDKEGNPPAGDGMMFSTNGGTSWTSVPQPLDTLSASIPFDTLQYGVSRFSALNVSVPEQNVIYKLAIGKKPGVVWTSQWSGGTRRSTDNGQTWKRIPLPLASQRTISPETPLPSDYKLEPARGATGSLVFLGFSVLVASDATVWAGTVAGVCKSDSGDFKEFPSWIRYDRAASGLSGNWITSIKEQPPTAENPRTIWLTSWRAEDNEEIFAASYTTDNGLTWKTALDGEKLYDFSFDGKKVYAVGVNGLFISEDGGRTFFNRRNLTDKANPRKFINSKAEYFSVQVEPAPSVVSGKRLWVGTFDGTAVSEDGGNTWTILRADVPVAEDTKTYAYPNPFAPRLDGVIRFRYKLASAASSVTIRVFDFSMNLVRTIQTSKAEEESWNGRSDAGARVANGVYFYSVSATNDKPLWGKVLVLE